MALTLRERPKRAEEIDGKITGMLSWVKRTGQLAACIVDGICNHSWILEEGDHRDV